MGASAPTGGMRYITQISGARFDKSARRRCSTPMVRQSNAASLLAGSGSEPASSWQVPERAPRVTTASGRGSYSLALTCGQCLP